MFALVGNTGVHDGSELVRLPNSIYKLLKKPNAACCRSNADGGGPGTTFCIL